jgi:anion-transporting  ArsA/GET3 family ATPase
MSDTFAGSQDYMATEKLYDLVAAQKYDLVVLDTPPIKNALDFLESPGRLINFLDERVLKWFLHPAEGPALSRRLIFGTSAIVQRLLSYVFGQDFLEDLTTFFDDFQGLYQGFVERHRAVLELFRAPTTSFVTVCGPTESSIDVATFFQDELARRGLPRGGMIVNQVHACEGNNHDANEILGAIAARVADGLPPSTVASTLARLGMAHRRLHALRVAEDALTAQLRRSGTGGGFYQEVPRLDGNVHDLPALEQVGRLLFEPAETL